MSRIDLEDFLRRSSPDNCQYWELLSQEVESTECENEVSDFVNHVTGKETEFDPNKVSDFNLTSLNIEKLRNLGLKLHILEYVSKGIPVHFRSDFQQAKIRSKPNSVHVNRNKGVIRQVIASHNT